MSTISPEIDLECALCKDIYQEPKTLGCLHSFCLECLGTYIERNHSNLGLTCPICRAPLDVQTQEEVEKLTTDSFLYHSLHTHNSLANSISIQRNQKLMCLDGENEATFYCLDCQDYFCEMCSKVHQRAKISKNHQVITFEETKSQEQLNEMTKMSPQLYCQIHKLKEIDLFCEDCKLPICSLCIDQHPSHKIVVLSHVVGVEKQLFIDLMNEVKPKEKELKEGIDKCEDVIKQLDINSTTTQTQINQFFNKIRIKLDEKEQELLNKLDEIEKYKKKELEIQKDELKFGIESIIGSCKMIENSLSLSNSTDVRLLSMKQQYESRLNYLSNNNWRIEPHHNPFIEFLINENEEFSIYSSISNIGTIYSSDISADKCLISRDENQKICENEEYIFEIISYSKEGNEMRKGGNEKKFRVQIEGELKPKNQGNNWEIIDLNNGRYQMKLKFKNEGKYLIFVQCNGIDIVSSPFEIQVSRNYEKLQSKFSFGSHGEGNGQFISSYGIATDSNGNVLVCDSGNSRVQIFDFEGKFISEFGADGKGFLSSPYGVTVNSKGNFLVSDYSGNKIQMFNSKGDSILTFGGYGTNIGQFYYPWGICVDSNDKIYVCEYANHRVQIFDSQGNFIMTFGSKGSGSGQFRNPRGIAINSKGNIIVCDYKNERIQIFNQEGDFISAFGSKGNGWGQFNYPSGICVDLCDNILVCDYGNNRIQVFDSNGTYLTQFNVNKPTDITIDSKTKNLFIVGLDNKVSVY